MIVNFDTQCATHITCTDIGPGQKILALRILAAQAHVLVVQAHADGDRIELYAIPQASAQHATFPLWHHLASVLGGRVDATYISDIIYLTHTNVIATVNLQFQHDLTVTLEYDLNGPAISKAIPITGCLRILPGVYHPIAYVTEAFDRTEVPKITSWWQGYNTRNMDYAQHLFTGPQMACPLPAKEWDWLNSLTQKYLKEELEKGTQNLLWDEGSGRMCIAHEMFYIHKLR
ncbi:hypothetical protein ARMGADRAFT_1037767 [Armillaria gallica]|uniref:Uncharacterized protein n=1 Tax=Armillaria gallica TaxID=47427 RepID=A0A2H3CKN6_ARMGA|nr:hypothetical protein ARMGADRAFT_1037767 [Armillaria gallica]